MRISKAIVSGSLCLFLAMSSLLMAQDKQPLDLQKSCKTYVQSFYAWYTSKAAQQKESSDWDRVLKSKRFTLSPELRRGLKEDADASAKSTDGIVGLDFDPFLDAQDEAERYVTGKVTVKGDR